jgi:hypothetical protein
MKQTAIQQSQPVINWWKGLFDNLIKFDTQEELREKDLATVKENMLKLILGNPLELNHLEQVEILKDVLSRFKDAKREKQVLLSSEGETIQQALRELTQHY